MFPHRQTPYDPVNDVFAQHYDMERAQEFGEQAAGPQREPNTGVPLRAGYVGPLAGRLAGLRVGGPNAGDDRSESVATSLDDKITVLDVLRALEKQPQRRVTMSTALRGEALPAMIIMFAEDEKRRAWKLLWSRMALAVNPKLPTYEASYSELLSKLSTIVQILAFVGLTRLPGRYIIKEQKGYELEMLSLRILKDIQTSENEGTADSQVSSTGTNGISSEEFLTQVGQTTYAPIGFVDGRAGGTRGDVRPGNGAGNEERRVQT